MKARLLIVDDDLDLRTELGRALAGQGYAVLAVEDANAALSALGSQPFDLVVTDLRMNGLDGVALCERVVERHPHVPVIAVTGFGSMETAVATLRAGAADFLTKPYDLVQLVRAIDRCLRVRDLEREVRRLRAEAPADVGARLGDSAVMRTLDELVDRIARTDSTVLVTGETGTGKELVARALHERGARRDGPFVAINCAALPPALLESELFGHERGAFTDAHTRREGLFSASSGGTLFLDEIGELPLAVQAKLLRALEQRAVRPIGSASERAFDARVVAATHRDLATAVADGVFREDLYFRVAVVHVDVPPLRVRGGDILVLAQRFLERFADRSGKAVRSFSAHAASKLLDYPWPGNVRELQNCVERAVALTSTELVLVGDLPPHVRDHRPNAFTLGADSDPSGLVTLEEMERRYLKRVLSAVGWNKTEATKILGIDRSTLYRKIERFALEPADE